MAIILKKNIMTAFADDVKSGKAFAEKVESKLGLGNRAFRGLKFQMGFEAIVRYKDLNDFKRLEENLKICNNYPISLHAPMNLDNPETVDLCNSQGYDVAEKLVEFADKNNISLIAIHPNCLRNANYFSNKGGYSRKEQEDTLGILEQRVTELNKLSKVKVALENKPQPATAVDFESALYSPVFTTFEHIHKLSKNIPIIFDTAHYAITRATIYSLLATADQRTGFNLEDFLKDFYGLFPEQCTPQPKIQNALDILGSSVKEIHLNDTAPYKIFEGKTLYWEGLVPERGCLVNSKDIFGFLKKQKNASVVFEVFEKDYSLNPNAYDSIVNFLKEFDSS